MSYEIEFHTVDVVIDSKTETHGVDAFALSLIKAERQIRRLATHLVFQFSCFGPGSVADLRAVLERNRNVYFEGFERGFDALYPVSIANLIGREYDNLRPRLSAAIEDRNKIFHGQLTSKKLTRDDLLHYVADIRMWCKALADGGLTEFEYDGFARNSFRKSVISDLSSRFKIQLMDIRSYEQFVRETMERRQN
jgi:hypothetical protein